jgi:hypothetical protein
MAAISEKRSGIGTVVYMVLGLIIWAAHLTVIYASQSALCARGIAGMVPYVVAAATVVALAVLATLVAMPRRFAALIGAANWEEAQQRFCDRLAVALAGLSLFAVAAEGAAILFVSTCATLR